jgi:hypothetical protein
MFSCDVARPVSRARLFGTARHLDQRVTEHRWPSERSRRWLRYVYSTSGFEGLRVAVSGQPGCIACMFFIMTASVSRSSSAGLNITNSVPGSCFTGTWPGGV